MEPLITTLRNEPGVARQQPVCLLFIGCLEGAARSIRFVPDHPRRARPEMKT
jgi:hypothetical protein